MANNQSFRLENHRGDLSMKHGRAGKTSPIKKSRENNIIWIKQLNRNNLENSKKEKQIQIIETNAGEKLVIQYPGKEAARDGEKARPWDFRPRVLLPNRSYGPNLTFGNIWSTFIRDLNKVGEDKTDAARALASLLHRMAFMADHHPEWSFKAQSHLVDVESDTILESTTEKFPQLYRYQPPRAVVDSLSRVMPKWAGMSLEAFLHYNDLMAWNEDCKFYFKDTNGGDNAWGGPRKGRINTLLTHLEILGYVTGDLTLSTVLDDLQRGRGVISPTRDRIEMITDGIVSSN